MREGLATQGRIKSRDFPADGSIVVMLEDGSMIRFGPPCRDSEKEAAYQLRIGQEVIIGIQEEG